MIIINKQPYSDLIDFEHEHDLTLQVYERDYESIKRCGGGNYRFYCNFDMVDIIYDSGLLHACRGDGSTVEKALIDYMRKISGQKIIIKENSIDRREIDVPIWDV